MKIKYLLEEKDFLINQLYIASQSQRIRKKRLGNTIIPSVIYLLLGVVCYIKIDSFWILLGFTCISILWFFYYPIWERHHYIQHFQSFIHEHYQARFNQFVSLEFGEEYLFLQDDLSEGKVSNHSILSIIELKEHILLQLGVGQNIILPKGKIDNIEALMRYLETWAKDLNITYKNEQNWKFK